MTSDTGSDLYSHYMYIKHILQSKFKYVLNIYQYVWLTTHQLRIGGRGVDGRG